MNTDSFEAKNV